VITVASWKEEAKVAVASKMLYRKYEKISPSESEWDMAVTVFQCLRKFYDLTELLSGTSYPTANLLYKGFCEVKELLDKWCISTNLTIRQMAIAMREKFEKNWSSSSMSLAVACFFDPRYKKRMVELYMKKFYGDYQVTLDEFISVLRKLYHFYVSSKPAPPKTTEHVSPTDQQDNENSELERYLYDDLAARDDSNELDKYMVEPLLKQNPFDILAYWKNKIEKYPTLCQIARDIMSIQVSTVASESAFSAAGRVIDPYRNRLDPEMVKALICTKDWIRATRKDSNKSIPSIVAELEPPRNCSFIS